MLIFFSVDKSDSKLIKQCVTNDFCLVGSQEQDCLTGNNVHPPDIAGANIIDLFINLVYDGKCYPVAVVVA